MASLKSSLSIFSVLLCGRFPPLLYVKLLDRLGCEYSALIFWIFHIDGSFSRPIFLAHLPGNNLRSSKLAVE